MRYLNTLLLMGVLLLMQGCSGFALRLPDYSPKPSEAVMARGDVPPLPNNGTAAEFGRVYMGTVGLYKQCEDNKKELVDWINKK